MPATPGGRKAPVPPERAKQAGMTLLTGHFVGRADELSSLERILDELDRGCPGAIELAGEPGIGKTRLLTELAARAGTASIQFVEDPLQRTELVGPSHEMAGK